MFHTHEGGGGVVKTRLDRAVVSARRSLEDDNWVEIELTRGNKLYFTSDEWDLIQKDLSTTHEPEVSASS